ncbi:MAG: hypothetical protein HQL52_17285 [Magnetococcales bacterium]|nr:hypothetical protein [Magnetococcales bacterium]
MNVQELTGLAQCIRILEAERIDYCLDEFYMHIPKTLHSMELKEGFQVELVYNKQIFSAFSDRPRSRQLIDIFDRRMTLLRQSKRLNKIYFNAGLADIMLRNPDLFPEPLDYNIIRLIEENPKTQTALEQAFVDFHSDLFSLELYS